VSRGSRVNEYKSMKSSRHHHDSSSPIDLHLDIEEKLSLSEATESIKSYLKHLKALKSRYKDIISELLVEENMNI
jgi:hypothetical protein